MINVIFPMAGEAIRFDNEFKPFIKSGDLTFIERAIKPFIPHVNSVNKFYFVVTEEQERANKVSDNLRELISAPFDVVVLPSKTNGPYQTIKKTLELVPEIQGQIVVCDCDHAIDVDFIFENFRKFDCIIPKWNISNSEQHKWSKVVYDKNELAMICEKEVIQSPDMEIFGIIGCIFFNSLGVFDNNDSDVYISDAIKRELKSASNIITYDPRFAYFFGDPERLSEFERTLSRQLTFFFDFDGTLAIHEPKPDYKNFQAIVDLNKLKFLRDNGHRIVITTGRSSNHRDKMIALLENNKIPYDDLVMDCNTGPRILINDIKPRSPFVKMARAINVKRNGGFEIDLDSVFDGYDLVLKETLGGYSPADKFVIGNDCNKFVRKILYKDSVERIHVDKLKMQFNNLKRFNFLWPGSVPSIYGEYENDECYYFDMEYLSSSDGWNLLEDSEHKVVCLENLLQGLNLNVYCMSKYIDGVGWFKQHIEEKIIPKFDIDDDIIRSIFFDDDVIINGINTVPIADYISNLKYVNFMPHRICPSHGDLTLENIFVNENDCSLKLIDPDGSDFYDVPELDLGKLGQSVVMKYSSWRDDDWIQLSDDHYKVSDRFFNRDLELEECLVNMWSDILVQDGKIIEDKIILFSALHLIRLIPFKLNKNKSHAVLSALLVRCWLNKLYERGL